MSHNNKTENYTVFFYYFFRNILLISIPLIIISAIILSSLRSSATGSNSGIDQIQFSLSTSCTMSSVVNTAHIKEISNGTYHSNVGKTTITTLCNDGNGYSIYANGFSNNEEGNNKLINSEYPEFSIDTGLATSGLTSAWAMKLNNIENNPSPTIETPYNDTYGLVPNYWIKVASKAPGTINMDEGYSLTTTYAIYTTSSQQAGIYNGQVKYVLAHPSYKPYVYYMQEVDKWKNSIAMEESVQAIDTRDGKKYWVTKLKDGNIWMTQNLDLDINGPNTLPLTSENTDISTTASGSGIYNNAGGYTVDSNSVWTWNPGTTTGNVVINYSTNKAEGFAANNTTPMSAEGGDTYFYTPDTGGNETRFDSLEACMGNNQRTEAECERYHVGNYYNWTAAIASNSSNGFNTQYDNAANSICPKGWRLPIATNSDQTIYEFGDMLFKQGITTQTVGNPVSYAGNGLNNIRKSPLWFVRSGYLNSGTLVNPASYSGYWSSTVIRGDAYALYLYDSGVYLSLDRTRNYGFTLRCIAR